MCMSRLTDSRSLAAARAGYHEPLGQTDSTLPKPASGKCSGLLGGRPPKQQSCPEEPRRNQQEATHSDGDHDEGTQKQSVPNDTRQQGSGGRETEVGESAREGVLPNREQADDRDPDAQSSVRKYAVGNIQGQPSHNVDGMLKRRVRCLVLGDDSTVPGDLHEVAPGEDGKAKKGRRTRPQDRTSMNRPHEERNGGHCSNAE